MYWLFEPELSGRKRRGSASETKKSGIFFSACQRSFFKDTTFSIVSNLGKD